MKEGLSAVVVVEINGDESVGYLSEGYADVAVSLEFRQVLRRHMRQSKMLPPAVIAF